MVGYAAPEYGEEVQAAIKRAWETFHAIVRIMPGGVEGTRRVHICSALSSQALEHFRAIVILCEGKVAIGSAFALFRPLLDTVMRAEWLGSCVTAEDFDALIKELPSFRFKRFGPMARELDAQHGKGQYFEDFTGHVYEALCGFTHSGFEQIAHRFGEDGSISPSYPENKIGMLVDNASRVILIHFCWACDFRGLHMEKQFLLSGSPFARGNQHSETSGN